MSSRNSHPSVNSGCCVTGHLCRVVTWNPHLFQAWASRPALICTAVSAAHCQDQCPLRIFSWVQHWSADFSSWWLGHQVGHCASLSPGVLFWQPWILFKDSVRIKQTMAFMLSTQCLAHNSCSVNGDYYNECFIFCILMVFWK